MTDSQVAQKSAASPEERRIGILLPA